MSQSNPHDALFKALFGDPRVSADAIRRLLPPPVAARIDWGGLEPVPTEFIGADLSDRRADLLFRARMDDHPAFLFSYLLGERPRHRHRGATHRRPGPSRSRGGCDDDRTTTGSPR